MSRMQIAQGLIKLQDLHKKGSIDYDKQDAKEIGEALSKAIEIILRAKGSDLFGKDY